MLDRKRPLKYAEALGPIELWGMQIKNLLSIPHWKSRLLLWGAAAAVGAAAVAFAGIADLAQSALRRMLQQWAWCPWLLAPIGCAGIAWLTQRYCLGPEGSGIPQTS